MNITVERQPADKAGPDIVDSLLTDDLIGRERGRAEINHNSTSRKEINGSGPKNLLMFPTKLVAVISKNSRYRGIITMYSRSYNIQKGRFSMDSNVTIEAHIPDTRPKNETSA